MKPLLFFCAKTKEEGNLVLFWQQCDRKPEKGSFLYQTQSIHWFRVLPCSPPYVCTNLIDADVFPHTKKKWFLFQIFMDSDSAETPRKKSFCFFFFSLIPSSPGARFRSVRMHQLGFLVKLDCLLPNPPFISFFFFFSKLQIAAHSNFAPQAHFPPSFEPQIQIQNLDCWPLLVF